MPIVWNTSGYERIEVIDYLGSDVDIYLSDFKYASADLAKSYSHAYDYPAIALNALKRMFDHIGEVHYDTFLGEKRLTKGVVVRHLVLPGCIDQSKRALSMLFDEFGNRILYSIMNQYTSLIAHPSLALYENLQRSVTKDEYEEVLDWADSLGIEDYFWQEGGACVESFIPTWDYEVN